MNVLLDEKLATRMNSILECIYELPATQRLVLTRELLERVIIILGIELKPGENYKISWDCKNKLLTVVLSDNAFDVIRRMIRKV